METEIEKVYEYQDENGNLPFQDVRLPGKQFRLCRPDSAGESVWNLDRVHHVLYNIPHVHRTTQEKVIDSLFDAGVNHLDLNGVNANRRPPLHAWEMIYGRSRPDAVIAIGSLRPTKHGEIAPHYLCPILVRQRDMFLHGILEWAQKADQTLYMSPNTLRKQALAKGDCQSYYDSVCSDSKPLYFPCKNASVRELVAITVDLDVGRSEDDYTADQALLLAMHKVFTGKLPQPSMAAYSGRGVYLLWLLQEEGSLKPPLFNYDTEYLWRLSLEELLRRTTDLKSDNKAKRIANWFKAPGTVDTKTGNEVNYVTFGADNPYSIPLHTLQSLISFLNLMSFEIPQAKLGRHSPPSEKEHKPKLHYKPIEESKHSLMKSAYSTKGIRQRGEKCKGRASGPYRARYQDIEKLAVHRGGIFEGLRHFTLLYYFSSVRACYAMVYDPGEAYRKAKAKTYEFNTKYCKPPQPTREVGKAVSRKRPKREPRSETITKALGITRDEATTLGLRALVPKALKTERMEAAKRKKELLQKRRDYVDAAVKLGKSTTEIISMAVTELELKVSRAFIYERRQRINRRGIKDGQKG